VGLPAEDVRGPGIALVVLGALDVMGALGGIAAEVLDFRTEEMQQIEGVPFANWLVGGGLAILVLKTLVAILGSGFVLYGGLQMLKLQNHTHCMIASVLVMAPCVTPCCCCVVGIPIGIWALLVLNRSDVRSAFGATAS
jgi:hypothetical protein